MIRNGENDKEKQKGITNFTAINRGQDGGVCVATYFSYPIPNPSEECQ